MQHAVPSDWLAEENLLYRLDPVTQNNVDEIYVTQVDGSRQSGKRAERAAQLLVIISAGIQALQKQQQEEARCSRS